jgi:Fur family ferric uptake transcriptional regulator
MAVTDPWADLVRERGLRLTEPRRRVLAVLAKGEHLTPEVLTHLVGRDGGTALPPSTIYRTLQSLEDVGIVTHTHLDHGPATYHLARPHRHLHVVCRRCRAVLEISTEAADGLVSRILEETGFRADPTHMAIHGHCAACAQDDTQATHRGDA